ncbi:ABC transporter ATP-binding protein [Spirosoma sp. KUDC1026]|uniref:ABC transporter ATP-binding protein n=1 Tax=Spirosoma sp. KUDC1026 TaxID=2745947 RepID=UPI00159BEF83|nr:ABC transporter ATP-binding protein [Spirosoma sp. KUDC1026]QKZ11301.1 ABC transporter ATP-binding protein [Spirosoma sp. KUDC1026]
MNESQPILTARNLTIGYSSRKQAGRVVAESLTLDVWPGQLVCLLGPNGAGKSTLMRTLAGLQPRLGGVAKLAGQELNDVAPAQLARNMSLVLAERVDAGNLRVRELVTLGRTPYTGWLGRSTAEDLEKVETALRMTNTLQYQDRRVDQLSDGERQKVMLARALAQDTDLILLDEPTAHLDLPNRVEMMRLLHQLTRQTGKAILLSTHELDLALQAADRLWLLAPGGKLATGTPEDLVLDGTFEATFARHDAHAGFYFDQETGSFTIHADSVGPSVTVTGDAGLVFWTRRALQREDFQVNQTATATCTIDAIRVGDTPYWTCRHVGETRQFNSVEQVLAFLQRLKGPVISGNTTNEDLPEEYDYLRNGGSAKR